MNDSLVAEQLARLPSHWLRHFSPRSIGYQQQQATYMGLKGWGRTLFVVRRGRLLYAPARPTGCVLRRTPILAWALLETLERHPDLPDVSLPFNCRDKPTYWYPDGPKPLGSYEIATTAVPRDKRPALAFAYTTGHTFSDLPLPDATFWGLPYARIPPWRTWLAGLARDKHLRVGTAGVGNGKLGFSAHPLRGRFGRCAPRAFGDRLVVHGVAKEDVDRLAWRCVPGECAFPPERWLALAEQCEFRVIIHLPGVSEWLEHFKHQLSCASLNVYVTEEKEPRRRDARREAEVAPPLHPPVFEHFDWWAPLLRAGEHYVHVRIPRARGRRGRAADDELCAAVHAALAEVEATPGRAQCIAERGAALARALTMERVHDYMAAVLRGAAQVQKPEVVRRTVDAAGGDGPLNVVTKRNLLRHVSDSTRPWIERIFLPSHGWNASASGGGGARQRRLTPFS